MISHARMVLLNGGECTLIARQNRAAPLSYRTFPPRARETLVLHHWGMRVDAFPAFGAECWVLRHVAVLREAVLR